MQNGCYECHGTQGQGNLSAGPQLAPHPIPYENFMSYVRKPRQDMLPYSAKILPENVARDIYAYLRAIPAAKSYDQIPLLASVGYGNAGTPTPLSPTLKHGQAVFDTYCFKCHGGAPLGPSLANVKARRTHDALVNFIENPRAPMPKYFPTELTDKDVNDVAAYLETL
jgi:mono/diheme cytochrome c family protein